MPDCLASMVWRRLDVPGQDACDLLLTDHGYRLRGHAWFGQDAEAASLEYSVDADRSWHSLGATVSGTSGGVPVELSIARAGDDWEINGVLMPAAGGAIDLDLAFSPSTNLIAIRRLDLAIGGYGVSSAAWLDSDTWKLHRLMQRYTRRDDREYWYESPEHGYASILEVTPEGFVRDYPGLWELLP